MDFRHVFKSRDALTMEAQIERLQRENFLLRSRLEEHGISPEINDNGESPDLTETQDEDKQDESTGVIGKRVVCFSSLL